MSFEVTTAFVQQYGSTFQMLSQQKGSRLRSTVMVLSGVTGKAVFMDQLGATNAQQITSRHADTPLMSTPHARRRIGMTDYNWADLLDTLDKVKMLGDPTSQYMMAGVMALGRKIDDLIIAAAFGDAATGETGATTVTFPAAQQVAVNSWSYGTGTGNSGLTISKLIEAKTLLLSNEVDTDEPLYIVASAKQLGNLLSTTEATSADYNGVKALVKGEMNTFMGFEFIRSQRLPVDANSYRRVLAYAKSGIGLAIGADIITKIDQRPDKNYSWQVYAEMSMGASRIEEVKVVEIKAAE